MTVILNPYLSFDGQAEEVLNFYKSIFGGEVTISRFGDTPGMPVTAEQKELVMHGPDATTDLEDRLALDASG